MSESLSYTNTDSSVSIARLQERLQYRFANTDLLRCALTHRSFSAQHNERLEFLGDAVLNLAVADMLYSALGQQAEGALSRIRANLVRQQTLHQLALDLGLPTLLRLGEGELKSGGARRPSILADTLEAIIGAAYLDQGFDSAKALVLRLFKTTKITPQMQAAIKDAKTQLQELLQAQQLPLPDYRVVSVRGAAHQQTFEVECLVVVLQQTQRGLGGSRRAAEQDAAAKILHLLQTQTQ